IAKTGPDMLDVDQAALQAAIEQVSGIPVSIGARPGSRPFGPVAGPTSAAPEVQTPIALDSPPNEPEFLPVENPSSILVYDDDLQRYDHPTPAEEAQPAYRPGYVPSSYHSNNRRTSEGAPVTLPPTYPARAEPPLVSSPPAYRPYPPIRQ
ncbi:MAG TPA: hypothetical protein P5330_04055, partial [Candidatus Competibacteraceae bacterium]|nr:hypothetical protein [Candidatus Competibacteraceae bacterium]